MKSPCRYCDWFLLSGKKKCPDKNCKWKTKQARIKEPGCNAGGVQSDESQMARASSPAPIPTIKGE